ncbi:hypothetical protein L7F22_054216 [Adiantum nelumboides]|nr:hypothetical protein [Adiantum nelumboides]
MLLSRRRVHATCNEESSSPTSSKFQVQALEEFVEFISLTEKFYNQVSQAHKSGHFLFGSFKWCGSGISCLQEKVRWMDGQLTCWNAALDRARLQFNCLNFFKGIELRLIHYCFSSEATTDQIQLCYELLKFVKPVLDRSKVESRLKSCICRAENEKHTMSGKGSEIQIYACLQHLSSMMQELFTSLSPELTFNQISNETTISDKTEDSILLITVEEQHLEFNVVVEIFNKHKKRFRSQQHNLILCSSMTSWEEVHLLLLRYSRSDDHDDSHVFVIAFIENLSFECQLQLALESQEMAEIPRHQGVKNWLVLVCWIGSQALQGISHHLKVPIQYMNGYAKDIIKHHLPEECCYMSVVTSELAGMGKSSKIKAHGSCVTVTVSREVTLESFILKLKNINLSAQNSLHIDITTEEGYESLNRFLFELLILGVLKSSYVGAFWLAGHDVYVELANTLGNRLEANLSVCSWLRHEHCIWELESLHVSEDLASNEQVVCLYLDALALKQLDTKDIVMYGTSTSVSPLSERRCKELLYEFFIKDSCQMSYSVLVGFLRTLAYQLRKLSATDFYTVETLCWVQRSPTPGNFRSKLVSSLVQAAKELSLRSVKPWLHSEQLQVLKNDLNTSMHMRMSSLLGWSDSNHVMVFFDMYGPVTVLYRDKKLIPEAIKSIMTIQAEVMGTQLLDYSSLPSLALWQILSPILGKDIPTLAPNYALTPDNFLKMALISLRINTQVPVIIMGETGCGKTSLLKALATCSNASFSCLTLHAGSTEQDIESFILTACTRASSENTQVWAFLDEINACHHLGFLNGILCHHTLDGNLLPPNLVVLAACNPYRLQDPESKFVGLQSTKENPSGHQLMAYKVQPLPEAMLDYVWDYGILSNNDERSYICAMIGTRSTDIIDVLSNSQNFLKCHLGLSSVSLRDIQRWTSLFDWLQVDIAARAQLNKKLGVKNVEGRAKVLACFLCYDCRLPTKNLRMLYREMCCKYIRFKFKTGRALKASKLEEISPSLYGKILHEEQLDILQRMEIPPGIAMNTSLLENVFVVLVCMLNCLPVFVVGKPGSGKTLALQIIYSNLRGADSQDIYYKQLPRMLMLSYQGSQNSTSEGILKVFGKAKRYVESNRKRDVLVVLVLDEIGLAETSGHNPLKVLHPLLEPDVQEIAVVGISNWSLDAAKMNRGIHLSQSDPEEEDLYDTGLAIFKSYNAAACHQFREKLRGLVSAYIKYHSQQAQADFHGLRDFYSLIKSLRLCSSTVFEKEKLAHSLWRNFGGGRSADIQIFLLDVEERTNCKGLCSQPPPVVELIRSNLQDPEARHLLLITKGDSASSILQHMMQQDDEFAIIQGSSYKDDKNEEYCYLLLGEIILHMEMGRHILLQHADQVWSSLYDMLNQHYTIVGGRKNCRIALGIYSNPMCYVHDKFRCIVIVDHDHILQLDPPFLNRFEKQILTYESILNDPQKRAVELIRAWAQELAAKSLVAGCPDSAWNDAEKHFFSGFFEDSIPSLVMYHWMMRTEASDSSQLIYRCKVDLLQTANVNAIARAHLQQTFKRDEFERWTDMFLSWDAVHSLDELIKLHVSGSESWADSIGVKLIVTTFTPLQWNIQQDIENTAASSQIKVYILRLGDFTSEKQLQTHIYKFWTDKADNLLVLQADDVSDRDHISLAKFHIDKARKIVNGETTAIKKHVILILHVQQGRTRLSRFSYLCGWKQLTIDRLQKEAIPLRVYLEKSLPEILDNTSMPIKRIMVRMLTWSYLCIKYEDKTVPASYPQKMVQLICKDEFMLASFKQRAVEWFLERKESLWQLTVLNNQKLLSTSASVHDAFVHYLEENFRECLARLVYLTEKTSSLSSYFLYDAQKQQVWRELLLSPGFLNYNLAPPPCYPEGYTLEKPLELQIPFSSCYAAHMDNTFKQPFMENISRQTTSPLDNNIIGTRKWNSIQRDVDASLTPTLAIIRTCIDDDLENYMVDFCNIVNYKTLQKSLQMKSQALEWAVRENLQAEIYHASDIHITFWEREKEIIDQAALASLCLATEVIDQHVRELKAGRPPRRDFKEDLAIQCCLSCLPTETCLKKLGGIKGWITKVKLLLKCVLPVGCPDMVFILQTLHDFAVFVILPLSLNSQHLSKLAAWFVKDSKELCTSSLVRKVVSTLPNLHTLSDQHECKCWIDFLCCMLKRHSHLPSLSENDLKIILLKLLTSASPSCMMGRALFQLLKALLSSRPNQLKGQNSIFEALFLSNGEDVLNKDWEDEINLTSTVLFVDFVYHELRGTMIPVLLNSEQKQECDLENFTKCLSLALQACEDEVPTSFKKVMALVFMKCFLYSTASLLSEAYLNRSKIKNYCQSAQSALLMISPNLRHTFQVFFMKTLHWDFGLSADDISNILTYCEKETELRTFSFLLDNSLIRNVRNRLGFNPFMTSSDSCMTAEVVLKKLVMNSNGEKEIRHVKQMDEEVMFFLRNAGQKEQAAFVTTIASHFFVMKSGEPLSDAEWNAMKQVRGLLDNLSNWDSLPKQSLQYLTANTRGGVWHCCEHLTTEALRSRCLMLDVLVTVMELPMESPLRGYCMLSASHLAGARVLTELDNVLQGVVGLGSYREYVCGCGYMYIIGDCTRPNEVSTCPKCHKAIGGHGHVLQPGNTALREVNSQRVIERSLAGKAAFSVRIQPLSYRLLRILVHYCFLIGIIIGGDNTILMAYLDPPNNEQNPAHVLTSLIEADMDLLDKLIACQREMTYQFIHSVLRKLPQIYLEGPLLTPHQRDKWEMAFERVVNGQPPHESISDYLRQNRTDNLNDVLQERDPCPSAASKNYFRMTTKPCFTHYGTMFVQNTVRAAQFPCVAAVLSHTKHLGSLPFLLPIVEFSAVLHRILGHKITRQAAATTTIQDILQDKSDVVGKYELFEASWNSVRLLVKGYECHQFKDPIPAMHKAQPIGLCLHEKKDQGIYLIAILEFLRTCQNGFLDEVKAGLLECSFPDFQFFDSADARNMPYIRIQDCKAEHVICFDEKWANDLVKELGMCNPAYGKGTQVKYDDYHIEMEMQRRLIQGKAFLSGEYTEFPYQQESFQRHATLISDVIGRVTQDPLPTEKLSNINRELTLEGLGPWQLLVTLELCLGYLRRMNAEPSELLRDYCERWLGVDVHPIVQKGVFDEIEVRHVVSLYEGLEAVASSAVEDMVSSSYRADLDAGMHKDLLCSVVLRKVGVASRGSSSKVKLGAEAFRDVLKRFMFRYLTTDTFKPEDQLQMYLTNEGLVTWPAEELEAAGGSLENIFPTSFQLRHARALYLALKQMCS